MLDLPIDTVPTMNSSYHGNMDSTHTILMTCVLIDDDDGSVKRFPNPLSDKKGFIWFISQDILSLL